MTETIVALFDTVEVAERAAYGDYRKFRVWDRTMLLKELSYAAPQTAFYPG